MIVAGLAAYIAYSSSDCSAEAYGKSVMIMSGLLIIVPIVMLLVHGGFFMTYVKKGSISCFADSGAAAPAGARAIDNPREVGSPSNEAGHQEQ